MCLLDLKCLLLLVMFTFTCHVIGMITNVTMKRISQHAFFYLSIICYSSFFVIMVLLTSTTIMFWLNYVFSHGYIHILTFFKQLTQFCGTLYYPIYIHIKC